MSLLDITVNNKDVTDALRGIQRNAQRGAAEALHAHTKVLATRLRGAYRSAGWHIFHREPKITRWKKRGAVRVEGGFIREWGTGVEFEGPPAPRSRARPGQPFVIPRSNATKKPKVYLAKSPIYGYRTWKGRAVLGSKIRNAGVAGKPTVRYIVEEESRNLANTVGSAYMDELRGLAYRR